MSNANKKNLIKTDYRCWAILYKFMTIAKDYNQYISCYNISSSWLNLLFRKGYDCVGYEMRRNYKKNKCMKRVLYFTLEKILFIAFINKS